ncbi:MAG: glucosamine-6-phosphate deaminase [Planctomycetota bacterium]|nr:glucosamine-6-phosphate deaminase [Planctomycetota bacterium]
MKITIVGQERIAVTVCDHASQINRAVAGEIAALIRARAAESRRCVIGLATGATPVGIYEELVRLHREEGLSFSNVTVFNLDQYFPMQRDQLQSYDRFMREHLFDHVDIDFNHVHIPDGSLRAEDVPAFCLGYEQAIRDAGGIELQLLGVGRSGHIGFNEPGSSRQSRTRLITLDAVTRRDAASDFFGGEYVPLRAVTMGVGTILESRRILLVAFGEGKAQIVRRMVEEPPDVHVPATFLQDHPDVHVYLDKAAAAELEREVCPWCVGPVEWTESTTHRAVVWLSRTTKKAILKLTTEDYNEHHLQDLVAHSGSAYELNLSVFRSLQRSINGWPGGKPASRKQAGDIHRPSDRIFPKRVLILSPHPDDDVISMGGTLIRLVEQGHEVHVAYQVSGNIAVFDHDALRFLDFASEFNTAFGFDSADTVKLENSLASAIRSRKPGEIDPQEVQRVKGIIRRGEARAAGMCCGIPEERLHFLDMPFYETGGVKKSPIGQRDIDLVAEMMRRVKPHQIYAAGDLSDPHGTHRVCLSAVTCALDIVRSDAWFSDCELFLYRGAWQEWPIEQIDTAVPLSPGEVERKRLAIFKHQSQKDSAPYPGNDTREFWQRAEQRNRATAEAYDDLGLAEYAAMEAFVRWDGSAI